MKLSDDEQNEQKNTGKPMKKLLYRQQELTFPSEEPETAGENACVPISPAFDREELQNAGQEIFSSQTDSPTTTEQEESREENSQIFNNLQEFFNSQTDFLSLTDREEVLTKQFQCLENNQSLTDVQETLLQMSETLTGIQELLDKMDKDFWT